MKFSLYQVLSLFNEGFTFYVIFPSIALLGLYLTIKLRFLQFSKLKMSLRTLTQKNRADEGGISHYQAVAAVLAGNFGTGNISGMAIALCTGGPGALVWMWIIAFLGAAIQYVSCILGVKYRQQNSQGEQVGGPMYYLSNGLNKKGLSKLFALFAVLGALTAGNFTQVNSMVLPLEQLGVPALLTALGTAALVAVVILGGMQRFAKIASSIVPLMALFYFGTAFLILIFHCDRILPSFIQMLQAAFSPSALWGGTLGYGVIKTITTGFDRGIFATDAGTGIVPILQASTQSNNPILNGIVTLIAPVLVMIVCTTTGLVIMLTGVWPSDLQSTNLVIAAFEQGLGSVIGRYVVLIALFLFSYTTILAWACCGERAVGYLCDSPSWIQRFRYFFLLMIPVGALIKVDLVWLLADISISLMLATNMFGIARLSNEVIADSRQFFAKETLLNKVAQEKSYTHSK